MNPIYLNYPILTPLTRIAARGNERILSNLANGRWIRISDRTLEYFQARDLEQMLKNLIEGGVSENDAKEFVSTLIDHDFINDGLGRVYPDKLSPYPISAYLNVTNHCNLSCNHCYYGSHPGLGHGLPNTDLFKVVTSLRAGNIENLVISGGEPMTRPGIEKLLEYIHGEQFNEITLLTNGTIVTDEVAAVVAECVDVVHVALDGPDDELNAVIRGRGNFDPAIKGIRKLKAAGVKKIRLITNINSANIRRIGEMKQLRDELGVELGNNVFVEVGRASNHRHLTPKSKDLIRFFLEETAAITCDSIVPDSNRLDIQAGIMCGSGTLMVSVDCHGDVYPCHLFHNPELRIGNLLAQPDLIQMLKFSPVAEKFRTCTVETRKCHGCDVEHFCKGGCLAHAVAHHDDSADPWTERDPFCAVHRAVLGAQLWPNSAREETFVRFGDYERTL